MIANHNETDTCPGCGSKNTVCDHTYTDKDIQDFEEYEYHVMRCEDCGKTWENMFSIFFAGQIL